MRSIRQANFYGDPRSGVKARIKDTDSAAFVKLLHGLMVLEYQNDELWYDVHPMVVDLLKREKLIE